MSIIGICRTCLSESDKLISIYKEINVENGKITLEKMLSEFCALQVSF